MRPILDVAADIGLGEDDLTLYGPWKAKIRLDRPVPVGGRKGKYVVVTSISPTPFGEGKTTMAIGLAQGAWKAGIRSVVALRQPSLGPSFGIKGGGAGGGMSTLEPASDINMHFTGDAHAVTAAHNACSAFLDNHLHHGNALDIDPESIIWRRVLDMNDRALRSITVGQGEKNGPSRQSGFEITAASEVMSILSVASSWSDLKHRLSSIVVGFSRSGKPVTAADLQIGGGMAALMRNALEPNLVQTQDGTPALVHSGPFGNVALGNSSIIADQIALQHSDLVITEAGFGSDLGFEKFCNVKCRMSGIKPDAAVIVVTIRSLKAHSGRFAVKPGRPLDPGLEREDLEALELGLPNLIKHIENVRWYGIPAVVAINSWPNDTHREIDRVAEAARSAGADMTVVADVFDRGGSGAIDLALAVLSASDQPSGFHHLYDLHVPVREKIERIAATMYGAVGVDYEPEAAAAIDRYEALGFGAMPVCMAKTQYSLSGNAKLLARPTGFRLTIRDVRLYAGAGYLVPIAGDIMLMPGLGKQPSGFGIDLLPDGTIVGIG
ncbi:MAG: formate--tetrahydrofolate ligase [Thermomicrobiales bacterium]|nr:formate--tetrahydrofolate ligase [Thermomicrobiales bacterium]